MLEKLKQFFEKGRGLKASTVEVGASSFVLLDPEKVAADLGLERAARENGGQEIPDAKAREPDSFEMLVESHLRALEVDQADLLGKRIEGYERAIQSINNDLDVHNLTATVTNTIQLATGEVAKGEASIYRLKEQYKIARQEFDDFRYKHGLSRSSIRNQENKILKIGIFAVLLLLETVINAGFFEQGSQQGLIGGAAIAASIAGLNVAVSFFIGWRAVPFKNLQVGNLRYIGFASILGWLIYVAFINLLGGHYREASLAAVDVTLAEGIGKVALARFLESPFGLEDLKSVYLIIVGFTFATVALLDGYSFDDPYPGFGRVWRSWSRLADEISEVIVSEIEFVESHFNRLLEEFQGKFKSIGEKQQTYDNHLTRVERLQRQFDQFREQLATVHSAVVKQYRQQNRQHRTSRAPKFFDSAPVYRLSPIQVEKSGVVAMKNANNLFDVARTEIPKLIKRVEMEHTKLRERIPTLEGILQNG